MVHHVHSKYPTDSFDYVVSEYLTEWYMSGGRGRLQCPQNPHILQIIERYELSIHGDPNICVKLALQPFTLMLRIDRNGLLTTDHETLH